MRKEGFSVTDEAVEDVVEYVQGIRPNIAQFLQQLLQVFFVGLTIGMQRNVVPVEDPGAIADRVRHLYENPKLSDLNVYFELRR